MVNRLSLEPLPYIRIVPVERLISSGFSEHNSDILIPVKKRISIAAASRNAFFSYRLCLHGLTGNKLLKEIFLLC